MLTFKELALRLNGYEEGTEARSVSPFAQETGSPPSRAHEGAIGKVVSSLAELGSEIANDGFEAKLEKLRGEIAGDMERLKRLSASRQASLPEPTAASATPASKFGGEPASPGRRPRSGDAAAGNKERS